MNAAAARRPCGLAHHFRTACLPYAGRLPAIGLVEDGEEHVCGSG